MSLELHNEPDLIQTLYGALTDRDGFHRFLEKLTEAVHGYAAQLLVIRRQPLRIDHLWHHGLSDELLNWYLDSNLVAVDVVINHAIHQAPGLFQSARGLIPDVSRPDEGSARWEDDQGVLDAAWLVVDSSASHCFLLSIQRTVEQGAYRRDELEALDRLAPHIRQAMQLYRQLASRSEAASSLSAVIDVLPDATVVLDSFASVLYSNTAARELIEREQCLGIRDERFSFPEKEVQTAFFLASAQVVRSSMGRKEYYTETLFLKRKNRKPLIFVIRPIESSELLSGGALVTIYEPDNRTLPSAEHIASYFELTPAEARVCELLIAGMDVQSIASHLAREVATVRYQLKQVFQKTGCSRQGELIGRILSALLR